MRLFIRSIVAIFFLNLLLTPASYAIAADLNWSAATTLSLSGVTFSTLTIASGSAATSLTVGTTTFTVTVPSGSTFTVNASADITLSNTANVATTCGVTSSFVLTGLQTSVVVTPTNTACPRTSSSASDRTPPLAPTTVKAIADTGGVTITWKDPVASDLSSIIILRNKGNKEGETAISGDVYGMANKGDEKYRDTNVEKGLTYRYLVRARDTTGNIDLNENVLVVAVPKEEPKVEEPKIIEPQKKVGEEKSGEAGPGSAGEPEKKVEEPKAKEAPTTGEAGVPTENVGTENVGKKRIEGKKTIQVIEKTNGAIHAAAQPIVAAKSTVAIAEAVGKVVVAEHEKSVRAETKIAQVIAEAKGTTEVAAVGFIVYGTTATETLGEGERAGALNSYKAAYGRLPASESEWQDTLRIAGGALPEQASLAAEKRAIAAFKRIYKRAPEIVADPGESLLTVDASADRTALLVAAYGIRPTVRSLDAEAEVIGSFKALFGKMPVSAADWDTVRMMAYAAPP